MDITFIIAIVALAIATALAVNHLIKRRESFVPKLQYYFQNEAIEAAYYDEELKTDRFPYYGSDDAAGFDLKAAETVTIDPGQFIVVKTGIHFNIPKGYELQIRSRSGLAAKYGIHVLNSPGTIDSDYTGEIKVILRNGGANRHTIRFGERIAQAVFAKVAERPEAEKITDKQLLAITVRGEGGLGSTGVK